MGDVKLKDILGDFDKDDYTVKLCNGVFSVVPGAPDFEFYNDLEDALDRVVGYDEVDDMDDEEYDDLYYAVKDLTKEEDAEDALWAADKIDTADTGLSIVTGVRNLVDMFSDKKDDGRTFEADPQQAADAALKGLAMAYMIYKLFPGSIKEKVEQFLEIPAGKEMAIYYAAVEIALPFADNLVEGGAAAVNKLMDKFGGGVGDKFTSVFGGGALGDANKVMGEFAGPLGGFVDQAKGHGSAIMDKIKGYLPSAATVANVADSATGAIATGADLMPVWRFLGARMVAEACAYVVWNYDEE